MIKKYRIFLLLVLIQIAVLIFRPELGKESLLITWDNALEMLSVLPPIFILLGLLDVWVKKETMVKYMGEDSGIVGILIAFFIGSAAAGPLYGAFPVAAVLIKKGSKLSNVFIMMGAWSTTKIPQMLFEATSMGLPFTALRFVLNLFGIGIIAYFTEKALRPADKQKIVELAEGMR